MLITEGMRNWKTPRLAESRHVYWPMIDRFNLTILVIILSKIMEVYESYGDAIPEELHKEFKLIHTELKQKKIKTFRNKYCGHILDKETDSPLPELVVQSLLDNIRGTIKYEDFEDWFWATGRPNRKKSIASCLSRIHNSLIKQEEISTDELAMVA